MNRVLLIIGGLLVGILAALFFVPSFVDWTRYRGAFEEEASRMLGREVRVGGQVNLRLLPTPFIRFEKIRVADGQASVGEPLFKAEDFTIWLAVAPLFNGTLQATEVELSRPVLTLVANDKGGGNWASLGNGKPAGSALPANIKLDAMRVTSGSVHIFGANGEERSRFERINGELSAESLVGPYKLIGAFAIDSRMREIRLSTAAPGTDGAFRFKGTVRAPQSGASFTLDGVVHDLLGKLSVDGELTAKLPVPTAPLPGGDAPPVKTMADTGDSIIDLKSTIRADTAGADLSDMQLSFEQDGRPQLASGSARIAWRDRTETKVELQSRWLDLDRIAGNKGDETPLSILNRFALGLEELLPSGGQTALQLDIDQATIGGDIASRIGIAVERTNRGLELRNFSASVPGGGRLAANGLLRGAGPDLAFEGDVALRGASLARFLGWAVRPAGAPLDPRRDGPFSLSGLVRLDRLGIGGQRLTVQMGGSTLSGEARYSNGSRSELVLSLEGAEIDVTPLLDDAPGPVAAIKALARKIEGMASAGASAQRAGMNLVLRLRVGKLVTGNSSLRDVVTDVRLADGRLAIPLVRIGSEDDWSLELRGDIADFMQTGAKGGVTGLATAETPEALAELAAFLDLPDALRPSPERAPALLPLRMAGRASIGDKGPGQHLVNLDGAVGVNRLAGSLRVEETGSEWVDNRYDAAATVEGPNPARILGLAWQRWAEHATARSPGEALPARLTLRAIGTPRQGLTSIASLDARGLGSELRGRLSVTGDADVAFAGDLHLEIQDAGRLLAAADPARMRPVADALTVSGNIAVDYRKGVAKLDITRGVVGKSTVSGKVEVAASGSGWTIGGQMSTSRASLPTLLTGLTERRAQRQAAASASAWSDDAFDTGLFSSIIAKLRIDAAVLELAPGINSRSAHIDLESKTGGLDIRLADAETLGGKLAVTARLEPASAGVRLAAQTRLAGGKLETAAAQGTEPMASGGATVSLDVEGTALSPRGLVTALAGKGEIVLASAQLHRFAPATVREVTRSLLAIKGELPAGEVKRQLEDFATRVNPPTPLGKRSLAVEVKEGVVRIAPLVVDTPEGRIGSSTTIDIDSLRLDSEWRIEAKSIDERPAPGAKARGDLAPMSVVYSGPIGALSSMKPRLDAEALEQDIVVRKVERDVEELERLRRLDEERARLEAERLKALEAERLKAIELERIRLEAERTELQRQPGSADRPPPPVTPSGAGLTTQPWQARTLPAGAPPGPLPATPPPAGASPPPGSAGTPAAPPADPIAAPAPAPKPVARQRSPRSVFEELGKSGQ